MTNYIPGDLVQFDVVRSLGVVIKIQKLQPMQHEEMREVLVRWSNGEQFWCLECTLKSVLRGED